MSVLDASWAGNLALLKALKDKGEDFSIKDVNGNNALLCACLGTADINTVKWLVHEGFSLEDRNNGFTAFLFAANRGHFHLLKFFKEKNADIRATNKKGENALHSASIGKADIPTIQWILDQGFSVEEKDHGGDTPFLNSAYSGRLELLKFFKERNADIRATNNDGENALHRASIGEADIPTIQWILDQGFSVEEKDHGGDTPFLNSAYSGRLELLKFFKERNADIRATNNHGENALDRASFGEADIPTIQWILDQGFSIEEKDHGGNTPFLNSAYSGRLELLKFFKERNADIRATNNDGENALHRASFGKADIPTIQWILDQGFSIEEKDHGGNTPFLKSAYSGRLELLKFFKERNADIRATNNDGENALHRASFGEADIPTIQWILDQGFSVEEKDHGGDTPFLNSAYSGRLELLKFFKERNADIRATRNNGENALHRASFGKADIPTIQWILDQGFSVEEKDHGGNAPFLKSAYSGRLELLKFFKERNADIRATNNDGENALHRASFGEADIPTIQWILDQGFSVEEKDHGGNAPFLNSVYSGRLELLKFFKERNADIRATNNDGENALHRASFGEADIPTIQWILDQGFSVEEKDHGGNAPFLKSAYSGRLELLKFFKERNADIRATNNDGENALHRASIGEADIPTIQWILDQGFSVEEKDHGGDTPFLNSAYSGRLELLKFFKEINADIRATNNNGENALHRASFGKAGIPTIKWLLQHGFSIETPNSDGYSPFYIALYKGHKQLERFFLDLKPDLLNKTPESR